MMSEEDKETTRLGKDKRLYTATRLNLDAVDEVATTQHVEVNACRLRWLAIPSQKTVADRDVGSGSSAWPPASHVDPDSGISRLAARMTTRCFWPPDAGNRVHTRYAEMPVSQAG